VTVIGCSKRWGRIGVPHGAIRTGSTTHLAFHFPASGQLLLKLIVGARYFSMLDDLLCIQIGVKFRAGS
jgi:hypothetical protein